MSKLPNWRLRFSLRALLFAMLLVGLSLSWLAQRANYNRAQRRLVERVWRIGGAVNIEGGDAFELPVFSNEWQIEANKGWLYDARVDCRPLDILFPNHTGIKKKTSDADLDELIDAVRKMPTVRQIRLTRMFHSEAGAEKVKQALPDLRILIDNEYVPLPASPRPNTP
jgi:hypothetical protein